MYTYYKDPQPACWIWRQARMTHGRINVSQAIVDSCNYFYYEVGRLTGIARLDDYATQFGLGQSTGIEIGDVSGVLASRSGRRPTTGSGRTVRPSPPPSASPTTPLPPSSWPTTWPRWCPAVSTTPPTC